MDRRRHNPNAHSAPTQPIHPQWMAPKKKRSCCSTIGCGIPLVLLLLPSILFLVYLLLPWQTTMLIMGVDRTLEGTSAGRTDTLILVGYNPFTPSFKMLSIPRDMWVNIPGVGENRINTAHYFAELNSPGSGPEATVEAINSNFLFNPQYYFRIQFEGFQGVVNAMGGVDIQLTKTMAGYPPGSYHLTGNEALAFVRDRAGTDDFFRMENGQFLLQSVFRQMLHPAKWQHLPQVLLSLTRIIDTNLPIWHWPRLMVALLRVGTQGIESHIIQREMVTPYTTSGGASVLLPRWEIIHPFITSIFNNK